MKKPNDPKAGQQGQQPAKPGAVPPKPAMPPRPGAAPAGKPVAGAKPAPAPAPRPAAGPARPATAAARPAAQPPAAPAAPAPGPNATPKEIIDHLAGQIQVLATRLEALRAQGAGNTTEFRQLEQMLNMVQDKLILAQSKIQK